MSKRIFLAGSRDYDGGAALPHCTGMCHGGREACDCLTGYTELACDIGPDDKRVIQPPIRTPEDDAAIARARRHAWTAIVAGIAILAAILELFGAAPFEVSK